MKTEQIIAKLLLIGVMCSAVIIALGGIWFLAENGRSTPNYAKFHSEPQDLRSPEGTLVEAQHFDSRAVIMTGLLVLIATPIFRVAFSLFAFAREKDWMYVGFTAIVLALLLFSLGH